MTRSYMFIPGIPGPPRALSGGLIPPPYTFKKKYINLNVLLSQKHFHFNTSKRDLPADLKEPSLWAESFSA